MVAEMTSTTYPRSRCLGVAAAGSLLAVALLLAVAAPQARAVSCSGPLQADGSFSFTCDAQLGTAGGPTLQRFILDTANGSVPLTSATISSPPGIVCFGPGDLYCKGAIVPAGTTVAGSVVATGPFCNLFPEPDIWAFVDGSPYVAIYAGGLSCPSQPPGQKKPGVGVPKWKKSCLKIKSKTRRKNCIKRHQKGK
jgi:hypothetical protein